MSHTVLLSTNWDCAHADTETTNCPVDYIIIIVIYSLDKVLP